MNTALESVKRFAEGDPTKKIASDLGLSHQTIEYHLSQIMQAHGLPSRIHLVHWALAHGLAQNLITHKFSPPIKVSTLSLAEAERLHILKTFSDCKFVKTHTAKALGISIPTLRYKLKAFGIHYSHYVHFKPAQTYRLPVGRVRRNA